MKINIFSAIFCVLYVFILYNDIRVESTIQELQETTPNTTNALESYGRELLVATKDNSAETRTAKNVNNSLYPSDIENGLEENEAIRNQVAIRNKTRFEENNSINKFYFKGNVLLRKVLNNQNEEKEGLSLEQDHDNATILSFMRFDKRDKISNKVTSELVTNWNWDSLNKTADNIVDSDDRSIIKSESKRSPMNDIVSKNITMLLENLLKNYENSQLPTHGKGFPTLVKTNMVIRSMGPVSELDMDYSMDCYFRQYWRDTRLSFQGPIKSLSLSIKMLERIWRPDTYFYNGKHSYVHTITVPNKLLRIMSQDGDILYSMRLTIKAKCPMELRNFPMDRQSCHLIFGSYAYTDRQLVYQWHPNTVTFVPGMTLSQFDLMSYPYRNFTFNRREGDFSVLQVSFNLSRHTGYFLIQVYVPCILIVVLSWVSFWIHREATSDRVGLGITTVLTLSTISLDSRTDLPKVRYATALDWFLLMSFGYCIATLLEFAGVHYFTKVGSGEIPIDDDEWEELIEETGGDPFAARQLAARRRSSNIQRPSFIQTSGIGAMDGSIVPSGGSASVRLTMERTTQTERRVPQWKQFMYCLMGNDNFRRQRQREAENGKHGGNRHINSISLIDRAARILFPASFGLLNLFYWLVYVTYQEDFKWTDPPIHSMSH